MGDKTHHTATVLLVCLLACRDLRRFLPYALHPVPNARSDERPQYPTLSPQTHSLLVTITPLTSSREFVVTFTHLFVSLLELINPVRSGDLRHPPLNQTSLLHSRQSISICWMNESQLAARESEDYQTDHIFISLVKNANHPILSNLS